MVNRQLTKSPVHQFVNAKGGTRTLMAVNHRILSPARLPVPPLSRPAVCLCYHPPPKMSMNARLYHGLFSRCAGHDGQAYVARESSPPLDIPCPNTGRPLRVA